jgi:hypothetical protein
VPLKLFAEGKSYNQIIEITKANEGTVRRRLRIILLITIIEYIKGLAPNARHHPPAHIYITFQPCE